MSWLKNNYLIIDYGASSIKGVLCEGGLLGDRILRLEKMPISRLPRLEPLSDDADAVEKEKYQAKQQKLLQDEYENNITRFLESFFLEQSSYILSLPLHKLYARNFSLPSMKPKQLAQAIAFEAEDSLPYSLEDLEVVGHTWSTDADQTNVLSFAAPHQVIENRAQYFANEQTILLGLSVDAAMLACFLHTLNADFYEQRIVGQLDIGASYTLLNVVKNGKLAFTRCLPYGGNQLTEIVASAFKWKDIQAAEEKKIELELLKLESYPQEFYEAHSISHTAYNQLVDKSRTWVEELCREIDRSLLGSRCLPPDCFYLSGGVSLTTDIDVLIKNNLQIDVERYPVSLDTDESTEFWVTALGAKEQRKFPMREKDNFLSTAFGSSFVSKPFNFSALKVPVTFLFSAVLIFLFSIGLGIVQDKAQIVAYNENIQKVASDIPGIIEEATPEEMLMQAQVTCMKRLRGLNRSKKKVLAILRELSRRSPSKEEMDLIFYELKFDGKGVLIDIEHANVGDSTTFQEQLSSSDLFRKVEVKRRNILPSRRARVRYKMEVVENKFNDGLDCR